MAARRSSRRSRPGRRHGNVELRLREGWTGPEWATKEHPDNTFGGGYYKLPPKLAGAGRFVDNLAPRRLVDHKVFIDGKRPIHMLTARTDRLSIMRRDMESLLALGLVRVQSNEPGTVAFYFEE